MRENFSELLESYFLQGQGSFRAGELVKGIVVHEDQENVYVDIGGKAEAILPKSELPSFSLTLQPGSEVEAQVIGQTPQGNYLLSVLKLWKRKAKEELSEFLAQKSPFQVKVVSQIKGGYRVNYKDLLEGFLPGSQADKRQDLIGQAITVLAQKVEGETFVVSQKAYLEKEKEERMRALLARINQKQPLLGKVKSHVPGGFLVELEGLVIGYLPFSELTYRRLSNPEEYLKIGDEVKVLVLEHDLSKQRFRLSLKALAKDPWEGISKRYHVDTRVIGTVVEVKPFGALVEIEPGVEGLIPASELTWRKGLKPWEVLKEGDRVEVLLTEIDEDKRRMILSLKRLEEDPWEGFSQKHGVGDEVVGRIEGITDFGLFIEVLPGVRGFVPKAETSWQRESNLEEKFSLGMEVRAKILELDPLARKLKLSLKALQPDPWELAKEKWPVGERVSGVVKKILPGRGYILSLSSEIQAFLPLEEVREGEKYKEGEALEVKIISLEPEKRRIKVSVKALKEEEERKEVESFLKSQRPSKRLILAERLKKVLSEKDL